MIRKFLLKILVNLYLSQNREISKISKEEELSCLLFKSQLATEKILRTYLTTQTLRYWEAKTDYERAVVKGGGLILQLLLDKHKQAVKLDSLKK
ncbi:hypothetical protein HGB13_00165 [bacterium]|nr:hypothetical protein [bacterium]